MSLVMSKAVSNSGGLLDSARDLKTLNSSMFMRRDMGLMIAKKDKNKRWRFLSLRKDMRISCYGQSGLESPGNFPLISNLLQNPVELAASAEQKVHDLVLKQASLLKRQLISSGDLLDVKPDIVLPVAGNYLSLLSEAYERCGQICAEYSTSYYLGTLLMTPERRKAIWAIYAWASRTDELVDGHNASRMTQTVLDRWESRLEHLFRGCPFDMFDAALSDTVSRFHIDIQPFKDMIEGMRMDLRKCRFKDFDELYLYCYHVAGTVGLMCVPVMGISPSSTAAMESVCSSAIALGIANQLTNILRDVGEDASMGRIYLPQDELAEAGLSDEDIIAGEVTDKWRNFMKAQIQRAKSYFDIAEFGVGELSDACRWPVRSYARNFWIHSGVGSLMKHLLLGVKTIVLTYIFLSLMKKMNGRKCTNNKSMVAENAGITINLNC